MNVLQELLNFQISLVKEQNQVIEAFEQALVYLNSTGVNYVCFDNLKPCRSSALTHCSLVTQAQQTDALENPTKCFLQTSIIAGRGGSGYVYLALEIVLKPLMAQWDWNTSAGVGPCADAIINLNKVYKMKRATFPSGDTLEHFQEGGYPPNYAALRKFSDEPVFYAQVNSQAPHGSICHFFFTPYYDGQPLDAYIQEQRPKIFSDILAISLKICFTVLLAHLDGILLRDIKPNNILITEEGELRIIDQESARCQGSHPESDAFNLTSLYAAPESVIKARQLSSVLSASNGVVMQELEVKQYPSPEIQNFWITLRERCSLFKEHVPHIHDLYVNLRSLPQATNLKADIYSLGMTLAHLYFGDNFMIAIGQWARDFRIYPCMLDMSEIEKKRQLNGIHVHIIDQLAKTGAHARTFGKTHEWLGLLKGMLAFNPKERITVIEVFYKLVSLYSFEKQCKELDFPPDFFQQIPSYRSGFPVLYLAYIP